MRAELKRSCSSTRRRSTSRTTRSRRSAWATDRRHERQPHRAGRQPARRLRPARGCVRGQVHRHAADELRRRRGRDEQGDACRTSSGGTLPLGEDARPLAGRRCCSGSAPSRSRWGREPSEVRSAPRSSSSSRSARTTCSPSRRARHAEGVRVHRALPGPSPTSWLRIAPERIRWMNADGGGRDRLGQAGVDRRIAGGRADGRLPHPPRRRARRVCRPQARSRCSSDALLGISPAPS